MPPAKEPEPAGTRLDQFRELLLGRLEGIVTPSDGQVEALWDHWLLYERWNQVLNLSSVRDLEGVIVKHYCESLFLGSRIADGPAKVVDAGSGAGFPGLPIAVLRRDCEVLLVESHRRKAVFLEEAVRHLPNASVFAGRLEELGGHFHWLVSRAVAWRDIARQAARLAEHVGLLVSARDASEVVRDESFRWREPVRVPWRKDGVVLVADVSRGTS